MQTTASPALPCLRAILSTGYIYICSALVHYYWASSVSSTSVTVTNTAHNFWLILANLAKQQDVVRAQVTAPHIRFTGILSTLKAGVFVFRARSESISFCSQVSGENGTYIRVDIIFKPSYRVPSGLERYNEPLCGRQAIHLRLQQSNPAHNALGQWQLLFERNTAHRNLCRLSNSAHMFIKHIDFMLLLHILPLTVMTGGARGLDAWICVISRKQHTFSQLRANCQHV